MRKWIALYAAFALSGCVSVGTYRRDLAAEKVRGQQVALDRFSSWIVGRENGGMETLANQSAGEILVSRDDLLALMRGYSSLLEMQRITWEALHGRKWRP